MINNNNTIIITTTIPQNLISEKRRNNLVKNFSNWNFPLLFNDYIKKDSSIHRISYEMIVNNINLFKKTNFDFGIICDDDFNPTNSFLQDLNETLELMPKNWRTLHLCPGYLWGRAFKDLNKVGHLNPEYDMSNIPYHESGRFYINCGSEPYNNKSFWLGAPIAFIINKNNVDTLLSEFINKYNECNSNNDVILKYILNENDFICREPLLGFENEEGGTTFS
jgi:hypothetical protein